MRAVGIALVLALALAAPAFASEQHPTQSEMESLLVCLQCKEPLDESDSIFAQRADAMIRVDIAKGETRSEIENNFVKLYGKGILAVPGTSGFDLLAWLLPFIGIGAGAVALGYGAWYWSRNRGAGTGGVPATAWTASRPGARTAARRRARPL